MPVADAVSPVVLIGVVRLLEFLIAAGTGLATYVAYLSPYDEASVTYAAAILMISAAAVLAFQGFEIYSITAFRSHIHQLTRLAVAWTLVFLVAFAISFFGKFDSMFSRIWVASWYTIGLGCQIG